MSRLWKISILRLGRTYLEAVELGRVLQEVSPHIHVEGLERGAPKRTTSSLGTPRSRSAKGRIEAARPLSIDPGCIPWEDLELVVPSELLENLPSEEADNRQPRMVEVNSGGRVFFCLFKRHPSSVQSTEFRAGAAGPATPSYAYRDPGKVFSEAGKAAGAGVEENPVHEHQEGILVIKFSPSRLLMQAEQFANELTRHMDICAPDCRLVRQVGPTAEEWQALVTATTNLGEGGAELLEEVKHHPCCLLMEYVNGPSLLKCVEAFKVEVFHNTVMDLGKLFLLDMVLGNPDRLPCPDLNWRGNSSNIRFAISGRFKGRLVAIDSCVPRRPPSLKASTEDVMAERMGQLVLNVPDIAGLVLRHILSQSSAGVMLMEEDQQVAIQWFQDGLRQCLSRVITSKGLLEMLHQVMGDWVKECLEDIQKVSPEKKGRVTATEHAGAGVLPGPTKTALSGRHSPGRSKSTRLIHSFTGGSPGPPPESGATRKPRVSTGSLSLDGLTSPNRAPIPMHPPTPWDALISPRRGPPEQCPTPATDTFTESNSHCQRNHAVAMSMEGAPSLSPPGTHLLRPDVRGTSLSPQDRPFQSGPSPRTRITTSQTFKEGDSSSGHSQLPFSCPISPKGLAPPPVHPSSPPSHATLPLAHGFQPQVSGCSPRSPPSSSSSSSQGKKSTTRSLFSVFGPRKSMSQHEAHSTMSPGNTTTCPPLQSHLPHSSPSSSISSSSPSHPSLTPHKISPSSQEGPSTAVPAKRSASLQVPGQPVTSPLKLSARMDALTSKSMREIKSVTQALRDMDHEAQKDDHLGDRVQHWKSIFRSRAQELKRAVDKWQERHQVDRVLTTGFLDGTHPIVDAYELQLRLDHMLRRLTALQGAAAACLPAHIVPGLWLGSVVCADAHHLLTYLGISHIINATEEVLGPPEELGFTFLRVPLRDVDDEQIQLHFEVVWQVIHRALLEGMQVLVHCHEGKSRSVTLVIAYLMREYKWTLRRAMAVVRSVRPQACPNPGFMRQLMQLEVSLLGEVSLVDVRKGKPTAKICPLCGEAAGISEHSLARHIKRRHDMGCQVPL